MSLNKNVFNVYESTCLLVTMPTRDASPTELAHIWMVARMYYFLLVTYYLINKSLCQSAKLFDAAIAEEWPPAAHVFAAFEVDFYYDVFFFIDGTAVEQFALRTGYKTASPEVDAAGLT